MSDRWTRLKAFQYPAEPTLDDGEALVEEFRGIRARVTITDRRIIVSRLGHRSIAYEDVVDLDGGWVAGPNYPNLRDNASICGGIYLSVVDEGEEWVHVPDAKRAAGLIMARTENLWMEHGDGFSIGEWKKHLQRQRASQ